MLPTKSARLYLSIAASLAFIGISTGCGGSSDSGAANTPLTGAYGGRSTDLSHTPAALQLTASGGQLTLPCGQTDQFNQPFVTDGSGHFSVAGTSTFSSAPVSPAPAPRPVVLSGIAVGDTITMTVTDTATHQAVGTFTVVKGKDAPTFVGGCVA